MNKLTVGVESCGSLSGPLFTSGWSFLDFPAHVSSYLSTKQNHVTPLARQLMLSWRPIAVMSLPQICQPRAFGPVFGLHSWVDDIVVSTEMHLTRMVLPSVHCISHITTSVSRFFNPVASILSTNECKDEHVSCHKNRICFSSPCSST